MVETTRKSTPEIDTNIEYWESCLQSPTPAYKELFKTEEEYLLANIKPVDHVLDIGCGEGRNMRNILRSTCHVTGVDNDQVAIDHARNHFKEIPTVQLVLADATKLPFEDESFDTVTFLMILPNLDKEKLSAIQESSRVLKKGGSLILSTFSETAFDERMKIYRQAGIPVLRTEGTKCILGENIVSEQSSQEELVDLGNKAGLIMANYKRIGALAHICKFQKQS